MSQRLSEGKIKYPYLIIQDADQSLQVNQDDLTRIEEKKQQKKQTIQQITKSIEKNIFLTQQNKKVAVRKLFPYQFALKNQIFIESQSFLDFLFTKLAGNKKQLLQALRKQKQYILSTILGFCQVSPAESTPKTIDLYLNRQLIAAGYEEKKVQFALQIAENNIETALKVLEQDASTEFFNIQIPSTEKQQFFLYQWLFNPQKKLLRIKLSLGTIHINSFKNSIKHRCPDLFKLMMRQGTYMQKLFKYVGVKKE